MTKNIKGSNLFEVSAIGDLNMTKDVFYKYVRKNNYEKVAPGIYAASNEIIDEIFILHKRCPNGVISHDDALYYYGLIDREPAKHNITVYSGYNASRITNSGYKVYYINKKYINLGKIDVKDNFGNIIPMYDIDRTIADMVRNRNDFEIQDFSTALKTYCKRQDKNLNNLAKYAKAFRIEKIIRTYMEVLI